MCNTLLCEFQFLYIVPYITYTIKKPGKQIMYGFLKTCTIIFTLFVVSVKSEADTSAESVEEDSSEDEEDDPKDAENGEDEESGNSDSEESLEASDKEPQTLKKITRNNGDMTRYMTTLWWISCLKKADTFCTKSCKRTYKDACDYYDCRSSLRRHLRSNCKKYCKVKQIQLYYYYPSNQYKPGYG